MSEERNGIPSELNADLKAEKNDIYEKLAAEWASIRGAEKPDNSVTLPVSDIQGRLIVPVFKGQDVIYTNQNVEEYDDIMKLEISKVKNNNQKLKKSGVEIDVDQDIYRDQGFTRVKCLVILPFKNDAYEFVDSLIRLNRSDSVINHEHFLETYGPDSEIGIVSEKKPESYKRIFRGNIDECFRFGLKFSRKKIKIFTNFYHSDIIVASPLGLKMAIDAKKNKKEYDFLSSVEILVLDRANVLSMQNWDHVCYLFDFLNLTPKEDRGTDFSRLKEHFLDTESKGAYRQNLIFSSYAFPELNGLIEKYSLDRRCSEIVSKRTCALKMVVIFVKQDFQRIECTNLENIDNARFEFFTEKVLPSILEQSPRKQTLIFVSSYFDYLRIKKYATNNELSFAYISEKLSQGKIASSRSNFASRKVPILVITERVYFYWRYFVKGVEQVVFYSPPENAEFYSEIINNIQNASDARSILLFTQYDLLSIRRLVGPARAEKMCCDKLLVNKIFTYRT